jgi:hypothetical protein
MHPPETTLPAPVDVICYVCGGMIPEGTTVVFAVGKGIRHTECPEKKDG